jgi:hypothetical protein
LRRIRAFWGRPGGRSIAERRSFAILNPVMWSGKVSLLFGLLALASCSGRSRTIDGPALQHEGEGGESASPGSGGTGGGLAGFGGSGRGGSSGRAGSAGTGSAGNPYDDPGCPNTPPPPGFEQCDPFATPTGCDPGFTCKPHIDHPYGEGCDQQIFNMLCEIAGSGVTGSPCDSGYDCGDGLICVVGAGAGSLCLPMCALDGSADCAPGYVCVETDAKGVGVCG